MKLLFTVLSDNWVTTREKKKRKETLLFC